MMIKKYPLVSFLVITYGITWLSLIPLLVTGIAETEILLTLGLFGPALGAYIVTRVSHPEPKDARDMRFWWVFGGVWIVGTGIWSLESHIRSGISLITAMIILGIPTLLLAWMCANAWNRRPSIRRYFKDLIFPKGHWLIYAFCVLYFPLSHYVFTFLDGSEYHLWPRDQTGIAYVGLWMLVSLKILLFTGGVNEETGWRGFLLKGLLEKFHPVIATLMVWGIWAVWHFPYELGPTSNMTLYQVGEKWLWMLPPTALFTWAFMRTGGSILVCALLHASMNATSEFIPITLGAKALTGVVAIGLVAELQFRATTRNLSPDEW